MNNSGKTSLCSGIFWVLAEQESQIVADKLLAFTVPCDDSGNPINACLCNSKSGKSLNHKLTWGNLQKQITCGKKYNYYPRGRVEIKRAKATIWLNQNILHDDIVDKIKEVFGLDSLQNVVVKVDNSYHYECHFDKRRIKIK